MKSSFKDLLLHASLFALVVFFICSPFISAQQPDLKARKFDEFTAGIGDPEYRYGNYERQEAEVKARLRAYGAELRKARARPYVITYSPRVVPYEAHDRSIAEMRAGAVWGLTPFTDWRNINVVNGGFRELATTELWIVPPGAQPPCPTPTVNPDTVAHCLFVRTVSTPFVPRPKKALQFKAIVGSTRNKIKPSFLWRVSRGNIVSGQGTDSISVNVDPNSEGDVIARVTIGGVSLECPVDSTTAASRTVFGVKHFLLDEFEDINCEDEMARLDRLSSLLQEQPELQVHLVVYGGRTGMSNEALGRATRMKNYLTMSRGVEPDRVLSVDGGYRNKVAGEWWLSLRGTEAPKSKPTVDKRFVRVKKSNRLLGAPCEIG